MVIRLRLRFAVALLLTAAACARHGKPAAGARVYRHAPVILISIDTLRADHLPAWGYRGVSTPNLDALRQQSVLFRNAYSHCPLTLPSHVSVFSGLIPPDNGVRDNIGYRFEPRGRPTLPEVLRHNGYRAGAAVSSYVLRAETGLGALFDSYDDEIEFRPGSVLAELERPGAETAAIAERWIDQNSAAPFFYFLHIYEPHAPYNAPEPFRTAASSAYDAEIAYADSIIGGFLDHLRQRGVFDRAIIVLIGDHGEGLGEHGESTHGMLLYREALHVPLLVKLPGGTDAGTAIDTPAGLTDVMPTILSLTGIRSAGATSGLALIGAAPASRAIFSESLYGAIHLGWSELRSVIDERYHYIAAPRPELYDVKADATEKNNVINNERRTASRLRDALARVPAGVMTPSSVSPEEAAKLAALGYLTSRPKPNGSIDPKDGIAALSAYQRAVAEFNDGDMQAAERDLRALLDANPNFTDARLQLARVYEATRRFADAADLYRQILARDSSLAEQVLIGLATCYLNLNRLKEARFHAEAALAFNRGGADLLLGRIALAGGDSRSAERYARDAAGDRHYKTAATLLASEALIEQRNANAATRALTLLDDLKRESAARGKPPIAGLELLRSDALIRLERADDAAAALRTEIQQFPRNREAYGRLAALHLLRGNNDAAEQVLEDLARADPSPASFELAAKTLDHFGRAGAAAAWRARERTGSAR